MGIYLTRFLLNNHSLENEMTVVTETPTETQVKRKRNKAIFAGALGNGVEWFENTAYASLAVIIAANFFDQENPTTGLLSTFALFAISFVFRPIGGIIFGWIGDRYGRRASLSLSVTMMGIMTALIGMLPTYETVGVVATVFLVLLRCLQGLSIGGEWGTSAVFLGEHAEQKRRGIIASWTPAGAWLGTGLAIGLVWVLTAILGGEAMMSWGWRIPFLVALPLALIGLWVRLSIDDTPEYKEMVATGLNKLHHENRFAKAWKTSKKQIFVLFMVAGVHSAFVFFAVSYMLNYLQTTIGVDSNTALMTNTIAVVIGTFFTLIWGFASDRIGRRTMLIIGTIVLSVISLPMLLIVGQGSMWAVLGGQLLLVACVPMLSAPLAALCVELFPASVRSTSATIATAVGSALFGGTVPLISASLVESTGNPLAPGWFLITLALATLLVVIFMLKETKPGSPALIEYQREENNA